MIVPAATPATYAPRPLWQAPLFPVAAAYTAGILLDRAVPVNLPLVLVLALASASLWVTRRGQGVVFLWVAAFFVGAAWHHYRRLEAPDSLARIPAVEERPVRLIGQVISDPQRRPAPPATPLRTFSASSQTLFQLRCRQVVTTQGTTDVSGVVQVWMEGTLEAPRPGDVIEIIGVVRFPDRPANPGDRDRAAQMEDQGIAANVDVEGEGAWRLIEAGSLRFQPDLFFAWLRRESNRLVSRFVPEDQRALALALLLGENAAMANEEWDAYLRTGLIPALAISGQHLVILAFFLAWLFRFAHVPRRKAAPAIAVFLFSYALMTGGRPPVMRAALMVLALYFATWLHRPRNEGNVFSLAWLLVGAGNPADLFQTGCLLSFLAVAVLIWGSPLREPPDAIEILLDEHRPILIVLLKRAVRLIVRVYWIQLVIWLADTPLIAWQMHLVTPVALPFGPPVVLLTSLALVSGFLALLLGVFFFPFGYAFGWLAGVFLAGCQWLVGVGEKLPGAYAYVADLDSLWVALFYVGLAAFLLFAWIQGRPRWFCAFAFAWLLITCIQQATTKPSDGFRCTFLAVGHGGCVVIETPDNSVLLYDAGAMIGPEVTRRTIAPYLWHRGIRRIDEIYVSHADLDHFNGLAALLDRFAVGRITWTPSFADRASPGVRLTLNEIERRGVPTRVVSAGMSWRQAGLSFEALHPPEKGPEGNENARSMVLLIEHEGLRFLLTGDLEGPGLARVLALPPRAVDVMMAPHHGSRSANTPALAKWANPHLVISCQGRGTGQEQKVYSRYMTTWEHGAVTVRMHAGKKSAAGFRSGKVWEWE